MPFVWAEFQLWFELFTRQSSPKKKKNIFGKFHKLSGQPVDLFAQIS